MRLHRPVGSFSTGDIQPRPSCKGLENAATLRHAQMETPTLRERGLIRHEIEGDTPFRGAKREQLVLGVTQRSEGFITITKTDVLFSLPRSRQSFNIPQ